MEGGASGIESSTAHVYCPSIQVFAYGLRCVERHLCTPCVTKGSLEDVSWLLGYFVNQLFHHHNMRRFMKL